MTTTVVLVRHGAHDLLGKVLCGREAGVELNSEGRAQASAVAGRLASRGLAAVYSGPLERVRQTAAPIAARAGLDVVIDPAIDEIDLGAWTGARFSELARQPAWRRWNARRLGARPPGGETMREAQVRMVGFLRRMAARHR